MYRYVNTVYNTYIHIYLYIDRYVCVCVCIFATIATKLRHIKSALSHLCSFYLKSNSQGRNVWTGSSSLDGQLYIKTLHENDFYLINGGNV